MAQSMLSQHKENNSACNNNSKTLITKIIFAMNSMIGPRISCMTSKQLQGKSSTGYNFNNLVSNISEFKSNWEVKALNSWHNKLFKN